MACELEQAVAAEASQHLLSEPEPARRPELGAEDAEREVGVGHELLELALPRGAVPAREAVELGDVCIHRRLKEHGAPVGKSGCGRKLRIDVLEAATVELVAELGVRRRSGEEGMPRAQ